MQQYRPEIDGLRALAVLPVMFFHAGFAGFGGGFVGVDIFFVISGYLITRIIVEEKEAGRFSVIRFYERRARRILPALFVVMAACLPFAWLWMLPDDRKAFTDSVIAVSMFMSNMLFWKESGYFGAAVDLKPLLHTWSLSIEEQFYIFFPLYLTLMWHFGWRRVIVPGLLVIAVLSIVSAQWASAHKPIAAFFLLPSRAWELLVGSLTALLLRGRGERLHGIVRDAGALAGLGLIAYSIIAFDRNTPFPSIYTLAPTLGTAAVIVFANGQSSVGRLLGHRWLVAVGLVSYSAYLWHQPLFAFARQRSLDEPDTSVFVGLLAVTLLLAYATWRFVERPFRDRNWISGPNVFKFAGAGLVLFAVTGLAGGALVTGAPVVEATNGRCNFDKADCYAVPNPAFKVALWGDSYADAFAMSLGTSLRRRGVSLQLFIKQSCPSIVGTVRNEERMGPNFARECEEHNERSMQQIVSRRFDYVVLTSAYSWYLTARNETGEGILVDREHPGTPAQTFMSARLRDTILAISQSGAGVLLVLPHPTLKEFRKLRKELFFGEAKQAYADFGEATKARLALISELGDVPYQEIDGRTLLCAGESCPVVDASNSLLLYDGSHISSVLAQRLAEQISERLVANQRLLLVPHAKESAAK